MLLSRDGITGDLVEAYNSGIKASIVKHVLLQRKNTVWKTNSPWYTEELKEAKYECRTNQAASPPSAVHGSVSWVEKGTITLTKQQNVETEHFVQDHR